jgi:hypothetical protein
MSSPCDLAKLEPSVCCPLLRLHKTLRVRGSTAFRLREKDYAVLSHCHSSDIINGSSTLFRYLERRLLSGSAARSRLGGIWATPLEGGRHSICEVSKITTVAAGMWPHCANREVSQVKRLDSTVPALYRPISSIIQLGSTHLVYVTGTLLTLSGGECRHKQHLKACSTTHQNTTSISVCDSQGLTDLIFALAD